MSVQQDSRVHNNLITVCCGTADLAAEIAYVVLRGSLVKIIIFHWFPSFLLNI